MKIATNVGIRTKASRRNKQHAAVELLSDTFCNASSVHEDTLIDRHFVHCCLASLPDKQRAAIWLRVGLEYTDEEVSEILGAPVGTVKSWIWRSMIKLRKECMDESLCMEDR